MKDSRINPDGSETIGILEDSPIKEPAKEEEKPKKSKKTKKN